MSWSSFSMHPGLLVEITLLKWLLGKSVFACVCYPRVTQLFCFRFQSHKVVFLEGHEASSMALTIDFEVGQPLDKLIYIYVSRSLSNFSCHFNNACFKHVTSCLYLSLMRSCQKSTLCRFASLYESLRFEFLGTWSSPPWPHPWESFTARLRLRVVVSFAPAMVLHQAVRRKYAMRLGQHRLDLKDFHGHTGGFEDFRESKLGPQRPGFPSSRPLTSTWDFRLLTGKEVVQKARLSWETWTNSAPKLWKSITSWKHNKVSMISLKTFIQPRRVHLLATVLTTAFLRAHLRSQGSPDPVLPCQAGQWAGI